MSDIRLTTPLGENEVRKLEAGDKILLSGKIYTARDAAHKRLVDLIDAGEELPFPVEGSVIYYVGPAPAKPGKPIGSAGPTTSYRMDPYSPMLIEKGQRGMIGKGPRGPEVQESMNENGAVYFAATGGAAALIAEAITAARVIAYEDLGAEAIRELEVEDFPLVVAQDSRGESLYEKGKAKYARNS